MLVKLEPFGRLGNRLFLGAHLIAFSLKHSIPVLNLGFGEYASTFPWFENNAAFAYPWRETGTHRETLRLARRHRFRECLPWSHRFTYWGEEDWDFDQRDTSILLNPLSKGKDVYFRSWLFRGKQSVIRFKNEILEVFRPPQDLIDETEHQIHDWRRGSPVLVGVHVRWEDYRGTLHYIDQAGFLERMGGVRRLWPERFVRFVLFSNEVLPQEGWGGLDVVRSSGGSPLYDLAAMARCDFLMGPPSTFSGWASFSASVPLLTLSALQPQLCLKDFVVVSG